MDNLEKRFTATATEIADLKTKLGTLQTKLAEEATALTKAKAVLATVWDQDKVQKVDAVDAGAKALAEPIDLTKCTEEVKTATQKAKGAFTKAQDDLKRAHQQHHEAMQAFKKQRKAVRTESTGTKRDTMDVDDDDSEEEELAEPPEPQPELKRTKLDETGKAAAGGGGVQETKTTAGGKDDTPEAEAKKKEIQALKEQAMVDAQKAGAADGQTCG